MSRYRSPSYPESNVVFDVTSGHRHNGVDSRLPYYPSNLLRGVVPVASTFDVNPSNLSRCTDGDFSVATGTGTKNLGGSGNIGLLVFDMGTSRSVMVGGRFGLWSPANTVSVYAAGSEDNITYYSTTAVLVGLASAVEAVRESLLAFITGRYVRLQFYGSGAMNTGNVKIYEVAAFALPV